MLPRSRSRKATLGLEGCSATQARAARDVAAIGKQLLSLRERKMNAISRGEDPSSWADQLFGKAADYFGALRTQDAACKSERANEDMLWKVLSCRIADIVNPDMTVKISIPGAEKLMGKASQSTNAEPSRDACAHERQAGSVPQGPSSASG